MDHTTGLTDDEFDELREEGIEGRPPILGLFGSLRATLIHLRHNIVQAAIGEILGVSQPTISRAVKALKLIQRASGRIYGKRYHDGPPA